MGDPQYWQGPRGPALLIAVFLLLLFLGPIALRLGILDPLLDRITGLPIWKAPAWTKMRTPVIIFLVIGSLAALLAYAVHSRRNEIALRREYAGSQGWSYSLNDGGQAITARLERILRDFDFGPAADIMTVETGRRNTYLLFTSLKHRDAAASRHRTSKVACLIESGEFPVEAVPVVIGMREWRGDALTLAVWPEVDIGFSLFSEKFFVQSEDPAWARKVVNGSMRAVLTEYIGRPSYTPAAITIGPGGAVVTAPPDLSIKRLPDLVDLARLVEATVEW